MAQWVNSYSTLSTLRKCFWSWRDGDASQFLFYLTLSLKRCIGLSIDGTSYTIINFSYLYLSLIICSLYLYVFDLRHSKDGADSRIFTFSVLYYQMLSLSILTLNRWSWIKYRISIKCISIIFFYYFSIISLLKL